MVYLSINKFFCIMLLVIVYDRSIIPIVILIFIRNKPMLTFNIFNSSLELVAIVRTSSQSLADSLARDMHGIGSFSMRAY